MRATLTDVAKMAGVSVATASRALTNDGSRIVAPGTQKRVLDAARQLNYQARTWHGTLGRTGGSVQLRTGRIGVLVGGDDKYTDPFWSMVLQGIDAELERHEYHIGFTFSGDAVTRPHQQALLTHAHVDGLVLVGRLMQFGEAIDPRRVVLIPGGSDLAVWERPLRYDIVVTEKTLAMHQIIDHLVAHGRRCFAWLGPPAQREARALTMMEALALHDLPLDPERCPPTPWTADGAQVVAADLLTRHQDIDALVCVDDVVATGALRAAKELHLRLPLDVSVTGFNDLSFARDLDPPLTTVRVDAGLLGKLAVRRLLERIDEPDLSPTIQMAPGTLIVRASCGAHSP